MNKTSLLNTIQDYKLYILSVTICIVVIILTSLFLIPNIQKIQDVIVKQKDSEDTRKRLEVKNNTLSSISKDEELELLKKLIFVLPEEKDVFSIFSGLDTLEKSSGLLVTNSGFKIGVVSTGSAQIQNVDPKIKYQSIDITYEVFGSKPQILGLLQALTSFKTRLFTAKNLNVAYQDQDHVSASFVLSAYYLPFPAQLGSAGSALPISSPSYDRLKAKVMANASLVEEDVPIGTQGKQNLFLAE